MTSSDKIASMHREYGMGDGFCRNCCNLMKTDRRFGKCMAYGLSHSIASDWSGRHPACGLYNQPFDESKRKPLLFVPKEKLKEPIVQIEGQTEMGE